jgi:hypothetical protein
MFTSNSKLESENRASYDYRLTRADELLYKPKMQWILDLCN